MDVSLNEHIRFRDSADADPRAALGAQQHMRCKKERSVIQSRLTHEHESLDLGAVLLQAAMEEHMELDGTRH